MASKSDIWARVEETLVAHKVKTHIIEELKEILAPKSGGAVNPPKEVDGVMHHFCRFHQAYEPEHNMVMSNNKSKGYCRAAISKWNKVNQKIKRIEAEAVGALCKGELDLAKQLSEEVAELKARLNDPNQYSLEGDWRAFNESRS